MTYVQMQVLNGLVTANPNRQAPTSDMDHTPRQFRHYVNASGAQDVQINNGLHNRIASGWRMSYGVGGPGYLYAAAPIIPGQTRGDAAGFHVRGPDPLSVAALWNAGPGSQPANPGGPGTVAGPTLVNPMTG